MAQGYKGFGSFHSDNVEELIANPELVAPDLPADFLPAMPDRSTEMGEKFKSEHFLLDPTWNFVNHGAFGGVCKFAMEVAHRWQVYAERQPLQFIDRELFTRLVYSIKRLAAFVNAPPAQVVLLPNVTTGLNTIAASCGLKEGGAVYMLDIAYGSSKKIFGHHCTEAKAQLILEPVPLPIESEDAIVDLVAATLPENAQLAVFDHITSNTAVTLPVQRLVELCHSRGVPVLIDGAHGLGQLPLDMTAIGADYYLSNGHKWLCCTKGTAFMYVAKEKQAQTLPLIKSHGFGAGFTSNFIWDGCRDYSGALSCKRMPGWFALTPLRSADPPLPPLMPQNYALTLALLYVLLVPAPSVPYVLDFWNAIGFDTVRMYSQQILRNAIRQLQEVRTGTDETCDWHRMSVLSKPHTALKQGRQDTAPRRGSSGGAGSQGS